MPMSYPEYGLILIGVGDTDSKGRRLIMAYAQQNIRILVTTTNEGYFSHNLPMVFIGKNNLL
jgi:hypothetical protein